MWLEIMTYSLSRTVTNKVSLIVGVFCECLTNKDTKMQGFVAQSLHKKMNWNFYYILPLEVYIFRSLHCGIGCDF